MYALDSDSLSMYWRGQPMVVVRVLSAVPSQIWLPAVVVEEQLRGRLAVVAKLSGAAPIRVAQAYQDLLTTLAELEKFQRLIHSEAAEALYRSWPAKVRKIGTRDCRIAASAITNGLTVVTRNRQDFEQMPGLKFEDWSA